MIVYSQKLGSLSENKTGYLPKALTGETGVLKKMTELTITTTRFTQFPTECVTGDTLASIMYDTCIFRIFTKINSKSLYAQVKQQNQSEKKPHLLVRVEAECSNKRLCIYLLNIHTLRPKWVIRD